MGLGATSGCSRARECIALCGGERLGHSPVPVALPDTLSIWEAMKLTCVLYVACTLRRIRSISLMVSSLPCRTSKSFHVCQNAPVVCVGWGGDMSMWPQVPC